MIVVDVLLGVLAGLVLGFVLARRFGGDGNRTAPAAAAPLAADVSPSSSELIDALPVAIVLLDSDDEVVVGNRAATELGVVVDGRLPVAGLRRMVRDVRRSGIAHEAELDLEGSRLGRGPVAVRVRLARLGDGQVGLLVEDVSEARRVEAVRRDFVANVGHELKTPVGAMSLLAEALLDAHDNPEAVSRFAGRVGHEAGRLGRLVQELIDLSRLQGADPLPEPAPVAVDRVVAEAVDRTRTAATARGVEIVCGGAAGLMVQGSESQLVTAVANLLDNAVAYSAERTRVAVGVRGGEHQIEISVSDQGIGIAEKDLERVFERFYRADPARSRATGGTGLGLAIVKHIATNHGGEVGVWSVEGSGSTFTMRLPVTTRGGT
ncbi:MAG: ATP-binding protein [Actinomycetota bacterium]|nr:ATP-binding protein [Actinomycetota bacterium]